MSPIVATATLEFVAAKSTPALLLKRAITKGDVTHALTPTHDQKIVLIVICVYALAILVLWHIPYLKVILLPFKLVTVALHEFSHAAAGLCTGARINSITIDPDEGGLTRMTGGKWCCVMPAGYLGSSFLGALMVFAGFNVLASKIVSVMIGVCLLATLFWAKNWLTRVITVLFVGLIVGLWFTPHGTGLRYVVLFMGVMSSLYCLWDIVDDTLCRKVNESDATKFAQKTHCSSRTQALLLRTGTEAQLCSQILRAVCAVDSNGRAPDSDKFGHGISQWIEHCVKAIKNTNHASEGGAHTDHDLVRSRLAAALVETVWVLGVEWEPDTADGSDERWRDEQLQHAEQNKALLQMTKALIASGVISPDLAKERLDADFLEQLGTIPSAVAFTRKYIRLNTTVNFKQTKFNLVSEQGEGFSKLVTLIQATMAAVVPHQISSDILRAVSDNPGAESRGSVVLHALRSLEDLQQRVRCLLVDVNRLIGVFNLDPNRVLDIILDCFMSSVRFYWAFYIALLDASPWCQSQADSLKVAQLVGWKLQFYINGPASDYKYMDELTTMAGLLITHRLIRLPDLYSMLQPSTSEAVDKEYDAWQAKQKEQQLGDAGGMLAKMGGLEDTGDVGEDNHAAEEASTNPTNRWANQHALLCAKLLAMGDAPSALVYMKRFPHMARIHQPLADLAARVVDASTIELYRRTDCVRAPVKPCLRLKTRITTPCTDAVDAWKLPCARHEGIADAHAQPNFVLTPLVTKPTDVFFYEKFWLLDAAQRMPAVCQLSDLPRVLAPWLNVAFLRLHESPALITRLMRLCRYGLTRRLGEEAQWIGALRAWILPSISFSTPSAVLSNEVWQLISTMPLAKRYELYGDWDSILTSGKPMLPLVLPSKAGNSASSGAAADSQSKAMSLDGALEDSDCGDSEPVREASPAGSLFTPPYVEIEMLHHEIRRKVRSIMRRLSGDTVKLMGRQLCSLCHPSPTLSIKIILDQVCSYDNLVDSVVEAFRYLTPLDADVLFFVVLRILDDPSSTKLKDDGVNAAHWLQCMSLFIASYSHRHENQRLDVVLDYILKRTVRAVRTEGMPVPELVVISDSVLKLAAIDAMANATEEQTLALQGGHHLSNEAFSMISPWILPQDATVETVLAINADNRLTKRMAMWLTNLIVNRGQALSFAVALSVHAEMVVKTASLPLSNVVAIYDREIERIYQLFHLMQSNLRPEKYARLIPGPHTLVNQYGMSWGLAILWGRPSVAAHLAQGLKRWEEEGEKVHVEIVELDDSETGPEDGAAAAADDAQHPTQPPGEVAAAQSKEEAISAAHSPGQGSPAPQSPTLAKGKNTGPAMDVDNSDDRAQPKESRPVEGQPRVVASLKFEAPLLSRDFVDHIARTLPPQALAAGLSPEFVAVFWVLTSHDVDVPYDRYEKEVEVQNNVIKRVDAIAKQSHSRSKTAQLTQIRSRASLAVDCLEKEMAEQKLHVSRIRKWLIAQKDYWFCMAPEQRKLITQALLQHCILPRAVLSASDASFCARFLWMMHFPLATNKFSLMIVYDNVFSDSLSTILAALTESEARCYAKFLNASLALLAPLHLSEAQYKERAVNAWRGLTGFQKYSRYKRGYLPPKSRTIRQATPTDQTRDRGDALRIASRSTMLSHDDFRTVMRKWQVTLTKAFISTLDSDRNDTVRNGILALREMQKTFPVISQCGRRVLDKVTEIAEGGRSTSGEGSAGGSPDSNKNLKVMATSYGAYLGMAKKNWISESSYYPVQTKDSLPQSPRPSNPQSSVKPDARATVKAPESADGGGSPRGSRSERGDGRATPSTEGRPDKSYDERARPPARRPILIGTVAMAAAAAAAATSMSTSVSPQAAALDADGSGAASHGNRLSTHDAEQSRRSKGDGTSRTEDMGAGRDHDGRRYRDRDRDHGRQRERQPGTDAHPPPLSADYNRRDSRSQRDSPVQLDREASHPEAHQQKRARDDSVSDSKLEPPRQRPATSISMSNIREVSPAASGKPVGSALPPSVTLATKSLVTKPSSEDADRKRKELRAQLLKQQEEKQKQRQMEDPPAVERHERDGPGGPSRHSSSERAGAGESKDGGSGRRDRRISSRLSGVNESPGQQQQPQHSSGRDGGGLSSSGAFGRLGLPAQTHATSTQGRQQQQQHQSRRQAQPDNAAQSNYVDRNSRRHGRGADGNRNHSPPSRDDKHALADEPASIRISSGRQAAKGDLSRSAGGNVSGGGSTTTTHRRGAGDARQSGENSDSNANGSRRGSKRGRGGGGESRDWSDGGKRRRK
ncbi:THO2 plays a role in transcriptional elongation [Coemansia pectinata]|uniref:THO complex subunit 2 n=1 Tax=Coemansia pectinata TaxID=1052879 RepID=A0A9W8H7E3_9FUNG|nr:THO2 plays a role in transcriptional elongation [Coemansia pectinata]